MMSDIKLLALDIDGTILTDAKTLTPRMKAAIEAAIAAKVEVVLVTGRPLYGIPDALLTISGHDYAITSNGAVTTDLKGSAAVRTAFLHTKTALQIVDMLRKLDLIFAVFMNGIGYVELEPFERHLSLVKEKPIEYYIRKSRRITYHLDELIKSKDYGVENIWFVAHDGVERDQLNEMIRSRWPVQTVLTGIVDVEVGSPEADKGLAVLSLAKSLGITKKQILAIGDSGNDLGMLSSAGTAVAMGNADENVKAIADFVTLTNEEDGAALVIERLLEAKGPNAI